MLPMVLPLMISSLLLLLVFLWLPVMGRAKALFGVALTDENYQGIGRKLVTRYRLSLLALYFGIIGAGVLMAVLRGNFIFAIGAHFLSLFAGVLLFSGYVRELWPMRVSSGTTRFASSLNTRRLGDYTVTALEVAIVVLSVAPFIALAYAYPSLPARIPVHWNGFGQPDRWANKSLTAVFLVPVLAVYMQAFLAVLKRDLVQAKFTIPADQAELYLKYKERGLELNIRVMDWACGSVAYLLAAISLLMLATNDLYRPLLPVISLSIWCATAILMVGLGYLLFKIVKSSKELDRLTGNAVVQRDAEAEGWKNGMYYSNRNDPAVLVEKLSGMGYTLNFGNPRAFLYLAFIVGLLAMVLWAVLSL